MRYNVQHVDNATVVIVEGKILNEQQTSEIRERIEAELSQNKRQFILDLKGLEFANSVCLNFLVSVKSKIIEKEGHVVLCNVSDQLKKLLTMTKLDDYFQLAGRTADALDLLNRSSLN